LTFISAHSPGEHATSKDKEHFWHTLSSEIANLPRRTLIILGVDANGHVGKDSLGQQVGPAGAATTWTDNGRSLAQICYGRDLFLTNTLSNCKDPGWTWTSRDGRAQTRIDYIAISSWAVRDLTTNNGVFTATELQRQGSTTDHRPVMITIRPRPLQQRFKANKIKHVLDPLHYDKFSMTNSCRAVEKRRRNELTMTMTPFDEDAADRADRFDLAVQAALSSLPMSNDPTLALQYVETALTSAMTSSFPPQQKVPRNDWVTAETWLRIQEKAEQWQHAIRAGQRLSCWGWE